MRDQSLPRGRTREWRDPGSAVIGQELPPGAPKRRRARGMMVSSVAPRSSRKKEGVKRRQCKTAAAIEQPGIGWIDCGPARRTVEDPPSVGQRTVQNPVTRFARLRIAAE